MASRTGIARAAVETASGQGWPLIVGNGLLCREVMALAAPGHEPVLPLHGGMGLAAGVAAGYLLARPRSGAIVLEGDGNHLMGWGCAQLIGDLGLPLIHIVSCNGVYRSTGGQRVPRPTSPGQVQAAAKVLGYRQAFSISTGKELRDTLADAVLLAGPTLLYVTEDPTPDTPARSAFSTADYADALVKHRHGDRSLREPEVPTATAREGDAVELAGLHAVQSITIRAELSPLAATIAPGTGAEGDIVLARVVDPGGVAFLLDWREHRHPVTAGTVLLGVLAHRDSTTHASGGLPAGGIPISTGTRLAWLGGQSGLLGIETWSPPTDSATGAQASATVEAIGLLTDPAGPVNIARLSRTPVVKHATAPVLVVCGTAAEVGKTTLACRLIGHLVHRTGLRIAAIKPTGSGGITDSVAHRQAGAIATADLIDCGLPSSYTTPERFAAHISRCLRYAEEHHPDLVVCELGGDLIWGNNDTFLRQPGLHQRIAGVLCVAGDATGALGARAFLTAAGLNDLAVTYAPAYTRNPVTFRARLARLAPDLHVLADTTDASLIPFLDGISRTARTAATTGKKVN
jgi:hypothetical protein